MKKIYIFAAVLALLTLSLNAQTKKAYRHNTTAQLSTAPAKGPSRASTTPVTPPYTNNFGSTTLFNWWEVINANNDTKTWTRHNSGYAQYSYHSTNYADDWLVTAPLTLEEGKAYTFSIETWCSSANYPEGIEVLLSDGHTATALENGVVLIQPTSVTATSTSHATLTKSFGVEQSGNYYIGIHAISDANMYNLYVDNFSITVLDNPPHDLSVELAAPTSVYAGETATVTARVFNSQILPEKNYTVNITANGNVIHSETVTNALAAGDYSTVTAQYSTTQAQGGQTVNFGVQLVFSDDDASNNTATAQTAINILPPPQNVAATSVDNSGTMTWNAPTITASAVTESFENFGVFPAFQTGGITTSVHSGAYGEWALYEPTGGYNYSLSGTSWPNANGPASFYPIAPNLAVPAWTNGAAHTGSQYMLSTVPTSGSATNHWLISPELSGEAQTITFWVREITTQYGNETFEVLTSSTDNTYSSFSIVGSTRECSSTDWTQVTVTLPAGSKYFAIRHTSVDIFGLMLDDITYTPAPVMPVSYNIYLDGQFVTNVDANTFSYTFNNLEDGEYTCAVSAVYDLGESAVVPTSFTINTSNPTIEITPATQTISDAAAGALTVTGTDIDGNINVSAASNDWTVNPSSLANTSGNVNVTYTGRALSASTTVTASATGATNATATVDYVADVYIVGDYGSGWNFNDNSNQMSYNNGTYTATITVNANAYILFARLLGNDNPWNTRDVFGPSSEGNWGMVGDSHGGNIDLNDDDPIHFPEGGTYRITIDANNGTFTITKLNGEQTAQPVITYSLSSDGQHVTITATGDGTVTLNVPGHDPVSGEGEVSITVPCGYASNTITVTATAKEDGKEESDPATAQINIPAGSDWVEMDGTYDDPNTLLSFLKGGEDIMMLDQFTASTLNNSHLASYIYTLREGQPGGEQKMSTPVPIPVYKTFSTMQGVYTKNQVDNDKNMKLKANVLNAEMDYDVKPDGNVLYYNLYRSNLNGDYPVIDDTHRVSKLQQFDEQVGDYNQFFLFESHTSGVIPRYDHFGNGIVERLDTNYVQGEEGNELSYVPVIWTLGINSARGDGKDNSYGSDIKRETMGNVTAKISGETTAGNAFGTWKVGETEYCVFHPTIEVTGVLPQAPLYRVDYNDGDYAEYEPYMCRAWCTYEGIHDFIRNSEGNLQDAGALTTPYWLGDATFDNSLSATIGGDWTGGAVRDQWSFGLPSTTDPNEVTYIIRFYYKKVVTDAQNQQNGGSGAKVGGEDEEYFMAETGGEYGEWVVGINELYTTIVPVDVTYVNPQGMQSSRPFDGVNIVVTRYSDGSTRTSKIVR